MGIKYVSEYLILNIFFFYIIIRFMAIFFVDDREEKKIKMLILIFSYLINSICYLLLNNLIVNMITSIISIFLISCLYKSSWLKRAIVTFMIYCICSISDIFVATIIGQYTLGERLGIVNNITSYCPLAAAGLAFTKASIKAWKFCCNFSTPNEAFPIGQ